MNIDSLVEETVDTDATTYFVVYEGSIKAKKTYESVKALSHQAAAAKLKSQRREAEVEIRRVLTEIGDSRSYCLLQIDGGIFVMRKTDPKAYKITGVELKNVRSFIERHKVDSRKPA